MTTVTPGSAELLELTTDLSNQKLGSRTRAVSLLRRLAAKPAEDDGPYLVWSNQHRAWWRPNSAGYTDDVKRAGRYSRAEAMSISFHGRDGWDSPKGVPDELAIAERDVPVFMVSTTGESKP